ncbi:MAG: hypothetical protein AAFN41_06400, partial [Planctomycetota bacterium]
MPTIDHNAAPPGILRPIQHSRSVLVNAALGHAFVRSLPFAGGLAVIVAIAWYLAAGPLEAVPIWIPPAIVALAFVAFAAASVIRRAQRLPTVLAAAIELDQSAKTHSALASSLEFAGQPSGPFEQWAVANAAQHAERGDLRLPTPPPIAGAMPRLGIGAGLLAVAITFVLLVPPRQWSSETAALAPVAADPERIAEVQEQLESAQVEVREAAEELGLDADDQFFDSLEAELEQGLRDPEETIARAAEQLDELAEQAETEADRAERARQDAAERLAELEPEEFGAARELAESIASGDFDQAAQDAEALRSNLDDPAARDDLRRLAEELDRAAEQSEPPAADPSAPPPDDLSEDLQNLADELREQADTPPPPPSPEPQPEDQSQDSPQDQREPDP